VNVDSRGSRTEKVDVCPEVVMVEITQGEVLPTVAEKTQQMKNPDMDQEVAGQLSLREAAEKTEEMKNLELEQVATDQIGLEEFMGETENLAVFSVDPNPKGVRMECSQEAEPPEEEAFKTMTWEVAGQANQLEQAVTIAITPALLQFVKFYSNGGCKPSEEEGR
jgi:hypothetical protein